MRTGRDVAVFVRRRDELLLLRHARHGYWHVVAGVVEAGETFAVAARRELREETGLVPEVPIRRMDLVQRYPVGPGERTEYPNDVREVTLETYVADAADEWEPALNEEHSEHRWCSPSDAAGLLHWPEARAALDMLAVMSGGGIDGAQELMPLVNRAHGTTWAVVRRISGGSQQGAYEVRDGRGERAVLKWHTRHLPPRQLAETALAIEVARAKGWPTPRWLAYGPLPAQSAYIVEEFVDGPPLRDVDGEMLERLLAINRIQAGLAPETDHDWSAYASRVVFDEDPSANVARLHARAETADFAARLMRRLDRARGVRLPSDDLVHGDFGATNMLLRDGAPMLVDAAHAGKGTRAYDLGVLAADGAWADRTGNARERILREAHAVVGTDGLLVCLAARMIIALEWGGRNWPAGVPAAVERYDKLLDVVHA